MVKYLELRVIELYRIEKLIAQRNEARKTKDFTKAGAIRKELEGKSILL